MTTMLIHEIRSYADCLRLWKTCRFPDKGKPLATAGWRMFRTKDTFELKRYNELIATVEPNNVLTMKVTRPPPVIERVIPVYTHRVATGRYRVEHAGKVPRMNYGWPDNIYMAKTAPELFDGLQFNIITGECLNRKPDYTPPPQNPEVARDWRKAQQEYRKGLMVRARMGVLDQYITDWKATGTYWYSRTSTEFTVVQWQKALAFAIREQDFSPAILKEFARHLLRFIPHPSHPNAKSFDIVDATNRIWQRIMDQNRTSIKKHFGVYDVNPK